MNLDPIFKILNLVLGLLNFLTDKKKMRQVKGWIAKARGAVSLDRLKVSIPKDRGQRILWALRKITYVLMIVFVPLGLAQAFLGGVLQLQHGIGRAFAVFSILALTTLVYARINLWLVKK